MSNDPPKRYTPKQIEVLADRFAKVIVDNLPQGVSFTLTLFSGDEPGSLNSGMVSSAPPHVTAAVLRELVSVIENSAEARTGRRPPSKASPGDLN